MKATVREYTVKKKVVVVEFTEEEAVEIAGGDTRSVKLAYSVRVDLANTIADALDADRAEEQRKEREDVPF